MILYLKRIALKDTYTIGKLYIDGEYFCDTLEDAVRPVKIPGETAIPEGTYTIIMRYSPKFRRILPCLVGVDGFLWILIHRGNDIDDTDGCILVGENKVVGRLINSAKTERALIGRLMQAWSQHEKIEIKISKL